MKTPVKRGRPPSGNVKYHLRLPPDVVEIIKRQPAYKRSEWVAKLVRASVKQAPLK